MSQLMVNPDVARTFDRFPPHSIEAEKCLLHSMFLDLKTSLEVQAVISADDFFLTDHQIVFKALVSLSKRGSVDATVLAEEIQKRGLLEEIGGAGTIADILLQVPSPVEAPRYAEIVREKSVLRSLIAMSNQLLKDSFEVHGKSSAEIIDAACTEMARLSQSTSRGKTTKSITRILEEVRERFASEEESLIPTGFENIDREIGGLGFGEVWLIGARPSMGKSTIARQIALRTAKRKIPTALFSLEESDSKIGRNVYASEAQVENQKMRRPRSLNDRDWDEIDGAQKRLRDIPLLVNCRLRRLSEIRSECAVQVAKSGVKIAVIDYLQLVDAGGKTPYERASLSSTGIAQIARDLQIAVLVTAQLNRMRDKQERRPDMTDLRDSGQLEQDADGIMLLHREDYYHANEPEYERTHTAELNIAKMRDGERGGTIELESCLRFQTFMDRAPKIAKNQESMF